MFTQTSLQANPMDEGNEGSSASILASLSMGAPKAESMLYLPPAPLSLLGIAAYVHLNPDVTNPHLDTPVAVATPLTATASTEPTPIVTQPIHQARQKGRKRGATTMAEPAAAATALALTHTPVAAEAAAAASSSSHVAAAPKSKKAKLIKATATTAPAPANSFPEYYLIEFFSLLDEHRLHCSSLDNRTLVKEKCTALNTIFNPFAIILGNNATLLFLKRVPSTQLKQHILVFDHNPCNTDEPHLSMQATNPFAEFRIDLNQQHPVTSIIHSKKIAAQLSYALKTVEQALTFLLGTNTPGFNNAVLTINNHSIESWEPTFYSQSMLENARYFFQSDSLRQQTSFSTEHVFRIQWKGKNAMQDLECRFYTNPYIYQQAENPALGDTEKQVTSWLFSENEMLKDYSSQLQLTDAIQTISKKRGFKKSKAENQIQLRYFWLRVFANNQEIIKLWLTFDSSVGELIDLHANAQMSGLECLSVFDFLDKHFLKLKQTYLCDDAGPEYTDAEDVTIKRKIPFRVTFPLLYNGESYYSKYSPGFKILNCTDRFNDHFNESLTSDSAVFLQTSRSLSSLTLDKLSQAFHADYESVLNKCLTVKALTMQTKKRARAFEPTKDAILQSLVKQFFPTPLSTNEAAAASSMMQPEEQKGTDLASITLKELLTRINDASKKLGAGVISTEMKQFNTLLTFPWQTINTLFSENFFASDSYYGLLYTHLINSRYWVRTGQKIESTPKLFQPAAAASASQASAMDIDESAAAATCNVQAKI